MKRQTTLRASILLAVLVLLCAMLCACARDDGGDIRDDIDDDVVIGEDNGNADLDYDADNDIYTGDVDGDFDNDAEIIDGDIYDTDENSLVRQRTDGGAIDGTPDGADTYGATYDTNLDDMKTDTSKTASHR